MAETAPEDIHFHQRSDGRRLAWRQVGQGPPLVMLHGWSMSGAVFHEVATALSNDFRVFCPDLTGHGWSDAGNNYSLDILTEDIAGWMNALELPDSAVLGWSMGGQVALKLAVNRKLSVSRLLLVSTTPCFCQKQNWRHGLPLAQVRIMGKQLQRAYLKTLGEFFDLQFAEEDISPGRRRELLGLSVRDSRPQASEDCIKALNVLVAEDIREIVSEIDLPVMILHGTKDRIIPCDAGSYLAENIKHAQMHLIDDVGHAPFMSCPAECVRIWRSFLS